MVLRGARLRGERWPTSFEEAIEECPSPTVGRFKTCGPGICAYEQKPNRTLLGGLGAQPQDPGDVEPGISPGKGRLVSTLSDRNAVTESGDRSRGPNSVFQNRNEQSIRRYLVLQGYDFKTTYHETHYVDLKLTGSKPGQTVVVNFSDPLPDLDWATVKAMLAQVLDASEASGTGQGRRASQAWKRDFARFLGIHEEEP